MNINRVLFFGIVVFAGLLFAYFIFLLQPAAIYPGVNRMFEIKSGTGFGDVADTLEEVGLVRSSTGLKWYGIVSGGAHLVKPGVYKINSSEGAISILEKFVKGPEDVTVVVPEGATLIDIDSGLSEKGVLIGGSLKNVKISDLVSDYPMLSGKKTLEGFLFPDTYRFSPASNPEKIVRKMLDNFMVKAWPVLSDNPKNIYERLIIASLLEKEVSDVASDREIVSGIIARRLRIGMALQIDAAVLYAACRGALLSCVDTRLKRSDYSIKSLYNTYLYPGLPPSPISNPGLHAIIAATHPKTTNYLYYLSDPKTGKTYFSEDFDEHNEKRAKYLGL